MPERSWVIPILARPQAERDERVHVAVLWGRGQKVHLEYLPGLPRLQSLASAQQRLAFEAVLEVAQMELVRGTPLSDILSILSPQMTAGQQSSLYGEPSEDLQRALIRGFLESPRRGRAPASASMGKPQGRGFGQRLDEYIRPLAPTFAVDLRRDVPPSKLYPLAKSILGRQAHVPIPRTVRRGNKDLLMAGIILKSAEPTPSLERSAIRFGELFWELRENRNRITELSGQQIRTVGLLLNGGKSNSESLSEGFASYVSHLWAPDVDVLVDGRGVDVVAGALKPSFDWLAGGFLV